MCWPALVATCLSCVACGRLHYEPVGSTDAEQDGSDGDAMRDVDVDDRGDGTADGADGTVDAMSDASVDDADAAMPTCTPWVLSFASALDDATQGVAVDRSGNVVATGAFGGTVDFGDAMHTASGPTDLFVVSRAPDGTARWSRVVGGGDANVAADYGFGIATSSVGDVFPVGRTQIVGGPSEELFVGGYTSAGADRWSHTFETVSQGLFIDVGVAPDDHLYAFGRYVAGVDFGDGPIGLAGELSVSLVAHASDGSLDWARAFVGTETSALGSNAIAVSDSRVCATGYFDGTFDAGGPTFTTAGFQDVWVGCYRRSDGMHLSSFQLGGPDYEEPHALAIAPSGALYVGGSFAQSVDFGDGARTSGGGYDVFIVAYDASGTFDFAVTAGDAMDQVVEGFAIDAAGNLRVIGTFSGTIDLGGGPLTSDGATDIFVAAFAPNGTHLSSERFGGPDVDRGRAIALSPLGCLVLGGETTGSLDFAGTAIGGGGGTDAFVAQLAP